MKPSSTSTNIDGKPDEARQPRLLALAGGIRLALDPEVLSEWCDLGPQVAVPGAAPWCLGLVQWRGRLLTLLDAGLLFGRESSRGRHQLVLRGLEVETALAVDEVLDLDPAGAPANVELGLEDLRRHPAFQIHAASGGPSA